MNVWCTQRNDGSHHQETAKKQKQKQKSRVQRATGARMIVMTFKRGPLFALSYETGPLSGSMGEIAESLDDIASWH